MKKKLLSFIALALALVMAMTSLPVGAVMAASSEKVEQASDAVEYSDEERSDKLHEHEETRGTAAEEQTIWNYLYNKLGNAYGAAGMMGNLYAESLLCSNNLEDYSLPGYTDESYTAAVDNGSYTNFVGDGCGYGLAQWTDRGRKQNLLNWARNNNVSISNLNMQLDFLWWELQNEFYPVQQALRNATSIRAASDVVLVDFEKPENQSESVKALRASYCQTYYNRYAAGSNSIDTTTISNRIDYLNNRIDYFTVNQMACTAGGGHEECPNCYNENVIATSWFRDIFGNVNWETFPHIYDYEGSNYPRGYTCCGFASFAEWYLFAGSNTNTTVSVERIGTWSYNHANVSAHAQIGDVINFSNGAVNDHYGIFISASSSNGVYVLDCNWDGYTYGSSHVAKHYVDYSQYNHFTISRSTTAPNPGNSNPNPDPTPTPAPSGSTNPCDYNTPPSGTYLNNGDSGEYVKWMQACLCQLGYNCTVDGQFGSGTETALRNFQRDKGLTVDGGFGPECRSKMIELLTVATPTFTFTQKTDGVKVAIKSSTSGSKIYYTLDGSAPTTSSSEYKGTFALTSTKTIKAIAVKSCRFNSGVKSQTATIYTVTFKDHDNSTIVARKVLKGKDATPPNNPTRPGYTFTNWDKEFTNVQSNLTVKAQYSANTVGKPSITLVNADDNTGIVTVKWSKPTNAHHYTLKFYKASDNTLVETIENITATTYTTTTELNAGKYYAKVTAYNADGSSSKTSDKSDNFVAPLVWTFVTNKSASLNDAPENGVSIRYIATGKTVKATEFAGAKLSRAKVKYGDDLGWVYYGALDTVKDPTWVYKVNNSLKMRAGVSLESDELAILPAGTVFIVTEMQGDRGKTTYNGMTGWVTCSKAKRITDPTQFTMPPEGTTLAQGATGEHVQWLQACLWQMGYFCELNGTYDADTEAALKLFKTRHGLSTSNGFNNACRTKLLDLFTCSKPTITYTISGDNATVTIGNINAWGTTYYTTNGSTPTESSTKYTGAFTVARGKTVKAMTTKPCRYDGAVATKTVTPATYTVTFKNWNGNVLSTQQVAPGEDAVPPANPEREGYTFTKWDKSYTNVNANLTVTAQFTINKYTVKFKNWNGTVLSTQTVNHGSAATAPANPTREGYTFSSWNKAFNNITSNLTVTAQFTPITPGKPVITSISTTNGSMVITWNAATNAHHYGVAFYKASDDSLAETMSNINGTSCIIELPAAKYYAKVTAYNIDEAGSKTSNASSVFVAPLVWTFVTNRSVALKDGPGNDYNTILNIGSGKTLKATEIAGPKLSRVFTTYSGHTGWAYFGYCDTVQDPTWVYEVSWSGGQRIIMREEVSTTSTILKYIPNGTRLVITEFEGNRAKTTYDGATGWISIQYTTRLTDPTLLEMPPVNTTLAQGDDGEYVEWLQACLWQMGYFCELNGVYDADTEAALTLFKSRHGLATTAGFNDECRTKLLDLFTVQKPTVTVNVEEDMATITINAPTSRSRAYYTIDESDPTTSSTPYTEPFTLPRGTIVRAIAVKECRYDSSITTKQVLPAPHTVTFKDWNGAVLNEQQVEHGAAAVAPDDPVRDGYVFIGWDKDFSNIIEDITVNALYDVAPTEPPVTEPPITEPPVTEPPVDEGAVEFSVESVNAVPGTDVSVAFSIAGEYEANAITVFIEYDPEKVSLNSLVRDDVWDDILDRDGTVMTNTSIAGSVRFMAILPLDPISSEGVLFTMHFHVNEDLPLGTEVPLVINVQQFIISPIDGEETPIDYITNDGVIRVDYLLGDVNGDGLINASDAILIMRHVLGVITLTDEQMIRADYNQDGQINASDALGIMRYSLNV